MAQSQPGSQNPDKEADNDKRVRLFPASATNRHREQEVRLPGDAGK